MRRYHGDYHNRYHKSRSDGPEKAECDEEAAEHLADRGSRREGGSGLKADLLEELAGPAESVASKPSKHLRRSMRGHDEANDQSHEQEPEAQGPEICCIRIHGVSPSLYVGYR